MTDACSSERSWYVRCSCLRENTSYPRPRLERKSAGDLSAAGDFSKACDLPLNNVNCKTSSLGGL